MLVPLSVSGLQQHKHMLVHVTDRHRHRQQGTDRHMHKLTGRQIDKRAIN